MYVIQNDRNGSTVARKNLKWQIHEAVMDSSLPSAARLLMFVFSDLADADSGVIPAGRKAGTSIKELARRTGLDAATVKRHKPTLVALGWLKYDEPTGKQQSSHETGDYTIAVGRNPEPKPEPVAHHAPPAGAHSAPPNEGPNGKPVAHGAPGGGAQRASGEAHGAPPIKRITNTDVTDSFFGPTADAVAPKRRSKRSSKPKPKPPRPDVEALCARLAELMIANECKPPTISQEWRDEARRMLDLDKRDFGKAMALLEWCQRDSFWKSNIQSMPTFRKQYDQLRLKANAEWEQARASPTKASHRGFKNHTDPAAFDQGFS